MISIGTEVTFEAGHFLPHYDGDCSRQHGHSYTLQVNVKDILGKVEYNNSGAQYINPKQKSEISLSGMVMDLKALRAEIKEVISVLDHENLNTIIDNPTAENILVWIYRKLSGILQNRYGVIITHMKLWETANNYVEYWG